MSSERKARAACPECGPIAIGLAMPTPGGRVAAVGVRWKGPLWLIGASFNPTWLNASVKGISEGIGLVELYTGVYATVPTMEITVDASASKRDVTQDRSGPGESFQH